VGIQRCAVKEDDGTATSSAPVQIVQTHSLPGNLLAFWEDDLHLNARNSGCEHQVLQLVCRMHSRFLFLTTFHHLIHQTRIRKGLRSLNWR
jgi:hypothetical protein